MDEAKGSGYRGSDTSRAQVAIYCHGDDPLLRTPLRGRVDLIGDITHREAPALTSARVSKRLGAGAGSWSFTARSPHGLDLLASVNDDDWVDIGFVVGGRRHHVMRGIVTHIAKTETEAGVSYAVSGREWSAIYELTELWFNHFSKENVGGHAALRAYSSLVGSFNTIPENIAAFLTGFLRELNGYGRSLWDLPRGLPGVKRTTRFVDKVVVPWETYWTNTPERKAVNASWMMPPSSTLWAQATEWSDPEFTELYPELLVQKFDGGLGIPAAEEESDFADSHMAVVLRDRPFPTFEAEGGIRGSLWYKLPYYELPMAHIIRPVTWSRSGQERVNAFFVSPEMTQEITGSAQEFGPPLWDVTDIRRHGIRRFDMVSRYVATSPDLGLTFTKAGRARLRDWHVLNPYFRSGMVPLKPGRPDIRIGSRLRFISPRGPTWDLIGYVEGVDHEWDSLETGVRSMLTMTRVWQGTDETMVRALRTLADRYVEAGVSSPGAQPFPTTDPVDAGDFGEEGIVA